MGGARALPVDARRGLNAAATATARATPGRGSRLLGAATERASAGLDLVAGPSTLQRVTEVIERPRVGPPGSGLGDAWRVIVRNDDHNTFDHVAHTLARTIPGISVDQGYRLADRIHNTGLAVVWSGHLEAAELYWDQLNTAGLTMAPLERG